MAGLSFCMRPQSNPDDRMIHMPTLSDDQIVLIHAAHEVNFAMIKFSPPQQTHIWRAFGTDRDNKPSGH